MKRKQFCRQKSVLATELHSLRAPRKKHKLESFHKIFLKTAMSSLPVETYNLIFTQAKKDYESQ